MKKSIDILMITYNRPDYTKLALGRLLETCDDNMRVWVWQNGNDKATVDVLKSFRPHPRFFKFNHSPENKKLTEPTNWLWKNSDATFFTKVDDDCIMPYGWADVLRKAHEDIPQLGVIGCWRFPIDDFVPDLARKKIKCFNGGHKIMLNCWIEGSGYLMKRECYEALCLLREDQSFTSYCIDLTRKGFIVGWYYPFLYQEHLDDPRCSRSLLKCNADMQRWAPLSAINNGVVTIDAWQAQLKRSALYLQKCPYEPKYFTGWRVFVKRFQNRLKKIVGLKSNW